MSATGWRNAGALGLLLLGLLQMAGDVLGSRAMKGLGAASAASPCPKVFTDAAGLEPFASTFTLIVEDAEGRASERQITPELYARLAGSYNRRNAYGAALAYAPRLPKPLWQSVFHHGMRPDGPLRREWGIADDAARVRVVISTNTRGRSDAWELEAP